MYKIENVINKLSKNPDPKRVWKRRELNIVDSIVIHQAAGYKHTLQGIARYHATPDQNNHISKQGAPGICYTFVIGKKGQIYQCNEFEDVVWHSGNSDINKTSVAICLLGDYRGPSYQGHEEGPNEEMLDSLSFLIPNIETFLDIKKIYGHCEINSQKVNCPGIAIMSWIKEYR